MSFESSPLWNEVKTIISSKTKRTLYTYRGTLHTEKEDLPIWELGSIEIVRDYLNMVAETGKVVFQMGLGDYTNRLYPYRDNLELTIKRIPLKDNLNEQVDKSLTLVTKYKAVFNPKNNPQVTASDLESVRSESLNLTDMVEVHLELLNRFVEPLRVKTTSGSFLKYNAESIIRAILGGESLKVLVDGKQAIEGLDLIPPDNKETQPQFNFPHGMHITSVPTFIQENLGGVYNNGIGTFFQVYNKKRLWFIYPTFDTERFDNDVKKVIFYAVNQDRVPQLDRSYQIDGNLVKIVVSAQRRYTDTAELSYINEGSGFRMPDARSYMTKPVIIRIDGPIASRSELNHETVTKDRKDNLNYAPMVRNGPSQNPFKYRSDVNRRSLAQIDLVWENADPELIYPGMPCKYLYMRQGEVMTLKGTILFAHIFHNQAERHHAQPFRTTCRLSISCETQTKKPKLPTKRMIGD